MLGVGLLAPAVEHVVGREMDERAHRDSPARVPPSTLTAQAASGSRSQTSTLWNAAQLNTIVGLGLREDAFDRRVVGDVELGVRVRARRVAQQRLQIGGKLAPAAR